MKVRELKNGEVYDYKKEIGMIVPCSANALVMEIDSIIDTIEEGVCPVCGKKIYANKYSRVCGHL